MFVKTYNTNDNKTIKVSNLFFNKKVINDKNVKYRKKSLCFNYNKNGYIFNHC